MSVLKGHTTAVLMPFATIPKGRTTVHVNKDILEMAENAKVQFSFLDKVAFPHIETFSVNSELKESSNLFQTNSKRNKQTASKYYSHLRSSVFSEPKMNNQN